MSHSIPPNNLEQLIAWIRLFAEQTSAQVQSLKREMTEMKSKFKEDK